MDTIVNNALEHISGCTKPHKKFIKLIIATLVVFQGKATFRNLSRYCTMSEKRISRWYKRSFDFFSFNCQTLSKLLSKSEESIAALDASFIPKSGKCTEGLGMFWSGCLGKAKKGLELSLLTVIDIKSNTAYALDAKQTLDQEGKTRVDLYVEQVVPLAKTIIDLGVSYLAVDAYYFKEKFVTPVVSAGLHIVGKLRVDADLLWAYEGQYSGNGRPKTYDGKVKLDRDIDRFEFVKTLDSGEKVYTSKVYSKCLKCWVKVVLLQFQKEDMTGSALLYSTDISLPSLTILKYYKARFQIEFVFRDAKQYTGLLDCQSCKKEAIHTHINLSFSSLNLLKLEDLIEKNDDCKTVISIASWKRLKFNQHLMSRVFESLGISLSNKKVLSTYKQLSSYGCIAA
jgi:hypothetical protein